MSLDANTGCDMEHDSKFAYSKPRSSSNRNSARGRSYGGSSRYGRGESSDRYERRDNERSYSSSGTSSYDVYANARGASSYSNRSERSERGERVGYGRKEYGSRNEYGRGNEYSSRREGGRHERSHGRFERKERFDRSERGERQIINPFTIYESSVHLGVMVARPVVEISDKGAFVDAAEHGSLFVPNSQLPEGLEVGDELRVFLYRSSDRTYATCRRPYIELGKIGNLRVNSMENGTAYLDLGIPKELVLPVSEQRTRIYEDDNVLVYVAIDEQGRLYGTQNFNRFIRDRAYDDEFSANQKVKVVATDMTPLGYRVVVDDKVYGLIYTSEQHGELMRGKRYDGYVRTVRSDGRLDISLQEPGREGVDHSALEILMAIYDAGGFIEFTDKSAPDLIEERFSISKGRFKKAIGSLYKQRFVELLDDGTKITEQGRAYLEETGKVKVVKASASTDSTDNGSTASFDDAAIDDLRNRSNGRHGTFMGVNSYEDREIANTVRASTTNDDDEIPAHVLQRGPIDSVTKRVNSVFTKVFNDDESEKHVDIESSDD